MPSARNALLTSTAPRHSICRSCSTSTATRNGTKKMRRIVSALGRFMSGPRLFGCGFLLTRISFGKVARKPPFDGLRNLRLHFQHLALILAGEHLGPLVE